MRYILWTGGLDSTYLLCKCARESNEPIQPLYILFKETVVRNEAAHEIKAQNELLPLIRAKAGIVAEIKDPIRFKEDELPASEKFDSAYERKKGDVILSSYFMYRGLGKLALEYPGLMIGIEAPAPGTRIIGRTEESMNSYGLTIDGEGNVLMSENGDKDMFVIYGGLKFCMIRINAVEELTAFKEWGYDDLPALCRTCVIDLDYQCGVCSNCETKMKYGDAFKDLMPRGYINHKIKEYLQSIDKDEETDYGQYYTWFIWGDETLGNGLFDGDGVTVYINKETSLNLVQWFNALRKAYPNFSKVDKAKYGF